MGLLSKQAALHKQEIKDHAFEFGEIDAERLAAVKIHSGLVEDLMLVSADDFNAWAEAME